MLHSDSVLGFSMLSLWSHSGPLKKKLACLTYNDTRSAFIYFANKKKFLYKKIPQRFADCMSISKLYHIYLKDECIMPSLDQEKFKYNWECLNVIVGLLKTDYVAEDLSYEVVEVLHEREDISNLSDTCQ